jgi:hypothetical protein
MPPYRPYKNNSRYIRPGRGSFYYGGQRTRKFLINVGQFDSGDSAIPTPQFIADNISFLRTTPFHGMVVYVRNVAQTILGTSRLMRTPEITYANLIATLAPIVGLNMGNLTNNFYLIQVASSTVPPDFFHSDWSVLVQNWANAARAARDAGLKGIMFDPEQYISAWADEQGNAEDASHTYAEYLAQAQLRGKQCMEAALSQFPGIEVMQLHGPYISEPTAPAALGFNAAWPAANDLMGAFFSGFVQYDVAGANPNIIDGGELYHLRTQAEFNASSLWRKTTLPSAATNCAYIPTSIRGSWAAKTSIAFGVYQNASGSLGGINDAALLQTTLTRALAASDKYVWLYPESMTYHLGAGVAPATPEFVAAVAAAKATA